MVLVSTDDYNEKKEIISDLGGKFDHHSKDTMWQGALKVLSEKLDELIGGERSQIMGLHINIQATRSLPSFLTNNPQLNVR